MKATFCDIKFGFENNVTSHMNCLCDLQMPFGAFVVPDEHAIKAIVDEMFGRSGNLTF